MRYVINRCHICGALISDANRNRLTDELCDGCVWNVEHAGLFPAEPGEERIEKGRYC